MSSLRITPVDDGKAIEGTWILYRGVNLRISRANNAQFEEIFNKLSRPHQHAIDRGKIDESIAKEIMCNSMGKAILVDWTGFIIDGKEVEYSAHNAEQLLLNDEDCRQFVLEYSKDVDNYLIEEEKMVVEKSSGTLNGPKKLETG